MLNIEAEIQNLLKEIGADNFLNHFNSKIKTNDDVENTWQPAAPDRFFLDK